VLLLYQGQGSMWCALIALCCAQGSVWKPVCLTQGAVCVCGAQDAVCCAQVRYKSKG
jgi:hypothetical protein